MTTYNDIADNQDRNFQRKCRLQLGRLAYERLVPVAAQHFQDGLKHPNPNKRKNIARRAYNIIFTEALTRN